MISFDHAGGLAGVARASAALLAGSIDIAVVEALDSLLHGDYLRWLYSKDSLKEPEHTDSLIPVPGEAAAVLVLEQSTDRLTRGVAPVACIASVALEQERVPLGPEHPIRAEGLSRAVRGAIEGAGGGGSLHRVLMDAAGERRGSPEWSLVETRCLGGLLAARFRYGKPPNSRSRFPNQRAIALLKRLAVASSSFGIKVS